MANYAYLRVSTHTQDVENQKLSVLDYCNSQGIAPIEFVEDTTSGRRSWRDREIGRLLETADAGDVLVAAEVSRLARSTLQVLELLQAAAERGVTVHIAKNRMVLDQSLPATITATILGLAAQIEREFISASSRRLRDGSPAYRAADPLRSAARRTPRPEFLVLQREKGVGCGKGRNDTLSVEGPLFVVPRSSLHEAFPTNTSLSRRAAMRPHDPSFHGRYSR